MNSRPRLARFTLLCPLFAVFFVCPARLLTNDGLARLLLTCPPPCPGQEFSVWQIL
jgi:hypothetical protein